MVKVLFVTSQLTYLPRNYQDLFVSFFKQSKVDVVGLVLLKNLDSSLLKSVIGLRYLGAKKIQRELIKNILFLPKKIREKMFIKRGIEVKSFKNINDVDAIKWVQSKNVDIIVNVRTRCIYRDEILNSPKLGCINIHHGILPQYRGTMCDLYALSENRSAGFTIHKMNRRIDDGEILKVVEVSKGDHRDYVDYLQLGAGIEGSALAELLNEINRTGEIPAGIKNQSDEKFHTKNPTRSQVSSFKQQGMVL